MKRYQLSATLFKPNSSDCLSGVEGQFSGMTGGYGMMGGYGMGSGLIAVPDRLPTPSNAEWIQNLSEVLSLEKRSYVQYTTDEKKYNVGMPYTMVIPQEVNHIYSIEKLFSAYGLKSDGKPENPTETTNLTEAYQFGIQMERD
ncbi:MAG: hypothetical protein LUQ47_03115, partial [Methanotrichaceae archaeon]|nr:hypothetical protein [Methanotrichaceae archaeon]